MSQPRVELLYFEGCPNRESARATVERVAAQLQVAPTIELVEVADAEAAVALRFLGSPTVRVAGRDVEPGADERRDFALSCRLYRTDQGIGGQPDAAWIREALIWSAG
jgi:hypothetical protein